jgi:Tfp pilus assembly protein PilF
MIERAPVGRTKTPAARKSVPSATRAARQARWVFNARFFWNSVGIFALVAVVAFMVHWVQVAKQAGQFLQHAIVHQERQEWRQALLNLEQYLSLRPTGEEAEGARVRLAEVYDQLAVSPGQKTTALQLMSHAVGLEPGRADLRIRLAEMLLESGDVTLAEATANEGLALLRDGQSDRSELRALRVIALSRLEKLRGSSRIRDDQWNQFADAADKAIGDPPDDIGLVHYLATHARRVLAGGSEASANIRAKGVAWANGQIDALLAEKPNDPQALLARYGYRREFDPQGDLSDLDRAAKRAPRDPDVLQALAERALRGNELERAREYLRTLLELAPDHQEAYVMLLAALRGQGAEGITETLKILERGVRAARGNDLHLRMEEVRLRTAYSQNRIDEARDEVDLQDAAEQIHKAQDRLRRINREVTRRASQLRSSDRRFPGAAGDPSRAEAGDAQSEDIVLQALVENVAILQASANLQSARLQIRRDSLQLPSPADAAGTIDPAESSEGEPTARVLLTSAITELARVFPDRVVESRLDEPQRKRFLRALELRAASHALLDEWSQVTEALAELSRLQPDHPPWALMFSRSLLEEQRERTSQSWRAFRESWNKLPARDPRFYDEIWRLDVSFALSTAQLEPLVRLLGTPPRPRADTQNSSPVSGATSPRPGTPPPTFFDDLVILDPSRLDPLRWQDEEVLAQQRAVLSSSPTRLEAWTGVLAALWRLKDEAAFRAELAELEQSAELPPAMRDFLVAQGYRLLGEGDRALELFEAAATGQTGNRIISEWYAELLKQLPREQAEPRIRAWLSHDPGNESGRSARDFFASAARRLIERRRRIPELLGSGSPRHLREALAIMEEWSQSETTFSIEEHAFLARAFANHDRPKLAERHFRAALEEAQGKETEGVLRAYFDFLLERGELERAEAALETLKSGSATSLATIGRHAHWLFAQGQEAEAYGVLEQAYREWRGKDDAQADVDEPTAEERALRLIQLGTWFDQIGAAERARAMFLDADRTSGDAFQQWLVLLLNEGDGEKAVTIALRLFEGVQASGGDATRAATLLYGAATRIPEAWERVSDQDSSLRSVVDAQHADTPLLMAASSFYHLSGDSGYAKKLYGRLRKRKEPEEWAILNNLASLLTEQDGGLDEAQQLLDEAKPLAGGSSNRQILDTEGMIHFRRGDWRPAEASFREALDAGPSPNPITEFHLAMAQLRLEELGAARDSFERAERNGLFRYPLSPGDRELLREWLDHPGTAHDHSSDLENSEA